MPDRNARQIQEKLNKIDVRQSEQIEALEKRVADLESKIERVIKSIEVKTVPVINPVKEVKKAKKVKE